MADTHTDWRCDTAEHPTFRVRVNVGRTPTSVTFDSTVEMTWTGTPGTYYLNGDERDVDAAMEELRERVQREVASRVAEARALETHVPKEGR